LRYCACPVSLWRGYKKVLSAAVLMTFALRTVSRLRESVKAMPPLQTWPSTSGSLSRLQASLSTTSSIMDTSCADLTSATPGRGCSYSPNGAGPARRRQKILLRKRSKDGNLGWVHQASPSSKLPYQRSQPPDDCGHRGDLVRRRNGCRDRQLNLGERCQGPASGSHSGRPPLINRQPTTSPWKPKLAIGPVFPLP
jgi:hypothetical protein